MVQKCWHKWTPLMAYPFISLLHYFTHHLSRRRRPNCSPPENPYTITVFSSNCGRLFAGPGGGTPMQSPWETSISNIMMTMMKMTKNWSNGLRLLKIILIVYGLLRWLFSLYYCILLYSSVVWIKRNFVCFTI